MLHNVTRPFTSVFIYFALFTDYEDDIFDVISNLHVQGSKFGRTSKMKLNSTEFMEFVFSKSVLYHSMQYYLVHGGVLV